MITAVPYFLSRLADSSLVTTFSSYLSISFTVAGLTSLVHATITSKQVMFLSLLDVQEPKF
jgi:equilibrative nucleoside transporter 1/2/3